MSDHIAEAWHLFEIRRALLTSHYLCFSIPGTLNSDIRSTEITSATASILYVNVVSLLDEASGTQMPAEDFEKCGKLANRLGWLNKRGKLLDFDSLDKIRDRRNDVSQDLDRAATVDELTTACSVIEAQLISWQLVKPGPKYELYIERGAIRNSTDPTFRFEHDRILRVVRDGDWVCEIKQTASYGAGS